MWGARMAAIGSEFLANLRPPRYSVTEIRGYVLVNDFWPADWTSDPAAEGAGRELRGRGPGARCDQI